MSRQIKASSKSIIQILVDHASPEAFFGWIDKGAAPHIKKYILGEKSDNNTYKNASISRNIITGYPSTSANSHTSIITGSYARKNNLLYTTYWNFLGKNPEYIDTEKISISGLNAMNKKHINPLCKLIFEYFEDSASFHAINRGATYKLLNLKTILFKFLPLLMKIKKAHGGEGIEPYAMPEFWKELFISNISSFLKKVEKKGKFPKVVFIVYLFTDEIGHKYGFNSEKYKVAIELLDFLIKCLVEGFKDKKGNYIKGLKELGYLDSIIWCLCTDHAARRVFKDKFIMINSIARLDLGLNIIDGENGDIAEICKNWKKISPKINGFSVIGGGLWHCWFKEENSNKIESFRKFYGEKFFRELMPFMKNKENEAESIDLIDYMLKQDYVQFVIIPEDENFEDYIKLNPEKFLELDIPRKYSIKIFSKNGTGIITRKSENEDVLYSYKILNGKDPLNYDNIDINYGEFYSQLDWLKKTLKHELPDIPHRLFGFFDCIHAPNFVITSDYNYHFLSSHKFARKKEKLIGDYQTHDGLFGIESVVPLTIAGPGIKKGFEIPYGRNIDILPTLLKTLEIEYDPKNIDGKPILDVFE